VSMLDKDRLSHLGEYVLYFQNSDLFSSRQLCSTLVVLSMYLAFCSLLLDIPFVQLLLIYFGTIGCSALLTCCEYVVQRTVVCSRSVVFDILTSTPVHSGVDQC